MTDEIANTPVIEVAARLRSLAEAEWGDEITTNITLWEDGDHQIEAYHTWVEGHDGTMYHGDDAVDYIESGMYVRKRWFESWICDSDGDERRQTTYQFGDGAIGTKERHVTESEAIDP